MEHKTYSVKAIDEEGAFEAVIATLNVIDKDNDVTRPGAFGTQDVVVLPTHDRGSVPLGKAKLFERKDEAVAQGLLNLQTEAGKEWHEHLKFDLAGKAGPPLQEWSYGFDVIKSSEGEFEGRQVRFLEELRVHEISPVLKGAGEDTRTIAVKGEQSYDEKLSKATRDCDEMHTKAKTLIEMLEGQKDGLTEEQLQSLLVIQDGMQKALDVLGEVTLDQVEAARIEVARFHAIEARISGVLDIDFL